ncbi:MAG TPA: DinB family protein [Pyrinomonadaceae bacterium]|nr:DinB family protein [Pyrinomonadaceae bacterium]
MKADLSTLIAQINGIATDTAATFGQLTVAQLNWKPSADRWSVAQCFDHLLTTNKGYFPIVDSVLAGQKRTVWQRLPFLPGLWGSLLIKSLDPSSTRKLKAPKKFQPEQSDISGSVIDDFVDQQAKIAEKMKATENLDLEKIIISSPVASPITYSLMDAYRIIVVHEQRHFQQAKRVTEETDFPVQDPQIHRVVNQSA